MLNTSSLPEELVKTFLGQGTPLVNERNSLCVFMDVRMFDRSSKTSVSISIKEISELPNTLNYRAFMGTG